MQRLTRVSLVWVFASLIAATSPATAATLIVGPDNCSDSGPGSPGQPLCSLREASGRLAAGDTLLLEAGTYYERLVLESVRGTEAQPVVIRPVDGADVTFNGSRHDFYDEGLIELRRSSYVTLEGFAVEYSPNFSIKVSQSEHVTVQNTHVRYSGHGSIIADLDSEYVQILDNVVGYSNWCGPWCANHEAITISEVSHFVVANNVVHDGLEEGIDAKDGSRYGEIYDNTVRNMGAVGIYLNHATDVRVHNNAVAENGYSGFLLTVGDYAMREKRTSNNEIFQNVAWGNGYNGIEFWHTTSGEMQGNRIYNNVFYDNEHYGVYMGEDLQVTNTLLRNNIIADNGLGTIEGRAMTRSTISHNLFDGGPAVGAAAVAGDPRFVDPRAGNFRLAEQSPARNVGFEMGLPSDGQPDIGAFEAGAITGISPDSNSEPEPEPEPIFVPPLSDPPPPVVTPPQTPVAAFNGEPDVPEDPAGHAEEQASNGRSVIVGGCAAGGVTDTWVGILVALLFVRRRNR